MLFYATPPRQAQQTCRLCTQQTLLFRFSLVYCSLSSGGFHKQHFPRYVATEIIYWWLFIWEKFQPRAVLAENCPPVLFVFYGYMMLVPCNFVARCFFLFFSISPASLVVYRRMLWNCDVAQRSASLSACHTFCFSSILTCTSLRIFQHLSVLKTDLSQI